MVLTDFWGKHCNSYIGYFIHHDIELKFYLNVLSHNLLHRRTGRKWTKPRRSWAMPD